MALQVSNCYNTSPSLLAATLLINWFCHRTVGDNEVLMNHSFLHRLCCLIWAFHYWPSYLFDLTLTAVYLRHIPMEILRKDGGRPARWLIRFIATSRHITAITVVSADFRIRRWGYPGVVWTSHSRWNYVSHSGQTKAWAHTSTGRLLWSDGWHKHWRVRI